MSAIVKGKIVDTNLSTNSRGGTEQMRSRLISNVEKELLEKVIIHFSRVRNFDPSVPNIFYAHDLPGDPESKILANGGFQQFAKIVFVSYWQRDQYIQYYQIPYSHCTVIENAIELEYKIQPKDTSEIRFIYHTTPHRGLELLYPIFDHLSKEFANIHLDVFSSFEVYGWPKRDEEYKHLFDLLKAHPKITYHGAKSNSEVLTALRRANIFLYPCIWQETSCIAMIEAIRSGCLVIHPSLGALPETASEATVMYDYTADANFHANAAYSITKQILGYGPSFMNGLIDDVRCKLPRNSLTAFTTRWTALIKEVVNG